MTAQPISIILHGVTGRMGTNQHLVRSILAIMRQGGVKASTNLSLMPDPILVGRNEARLRTLAETHSVSTVRLPWTTDVDGVLADPRYGIIFDASTTEQRAGFVERAARAKEAIYCEKPTATTTVEALRVATLCGSAVAAALVELSGGGRRRGYLGYRLPLAVRDGQPVWSREVSTLFRRHPPTRTSG